MASDIPKEPLLMARLFANDLPERSSLLEVLVSDMGLEATDFPNPFLMFSQRAQSLRLSTFDVLVKCDRLKRRADVVGIGAVVVREIHESITLERAVHL